MFQIKGPILAAMDLDKGSEELIRQVEPLRVRTRSSFMLSTLARTMGPVPGGLGIFEAASVATLKAIGVPIAAGFAATLPYRGFSYWLPMAPGVLLARRETRT